MNWEQTRAYMAELKERYGAEIDNETVGRAVEYIAEAGRHADEAKAFAASFREEASRAFHPDGIEFYAIARSIVATIEAAVATLEETAKNELEEALASKDDPTDDAALIAFAQSTAAAAEGYRAIIKRTTEAAADVFQTFARSLRFVAEKQQGEQDDDARD